MKTITQFKYIFISTHILWVISGLSVVGQEPTYWELTDTDGLPSMTVYEIIQDDLGYIWMGTTNGLCRYDGGNFTNFKNPKLKDNEILKIRKDGWNRIWFVNLSGQLSYVGKDYLIHLYSSPHLAEKEIVEFVTGEKFLWILTKGSTNESPLLLICDLKERKNPVVKKIVELKPTISAITRQSIKDYFQCDFTSNNSRLSLLQNTPLQDFQHKLSFDFNIPYISLKDKNNILSLSLTNREEEKELFSIGHITNVINFKIIDTSLWIVTRNAVWKKRLNKGLYPIAPAQKIIKDINANYVFIDTENNCWVSTNGQGVRVIPPGSMQLLNTTNGNLPNDIVYCLFYDSLEHRLIAGHAKGQISIHSPGSPPQFLDLNLYGKVRCIIQANEGAYLIGAESGSILLDQKLRPIQTIKTIGFKTFFIDQKRRVWVGHSLFAGYQENTNQLTLTDEKGMAKIIRERTYAIYQDRQKNIWLGTTKGLYLFKDSLTPFTENGIQKSYYVTDIAESADSTLWVSTNSNGILAIQNKQIIHRFDHSNGLSSNQCKKMFWDGDLLWIATVNGLNHLNPKTNKIGWINKKDGLPSHEIHDVLLVDQQVWVATSGGIVYFPKEMGHFNAAAPRIYLTALKIWEETYPFDSIVQVPYDQNNFQIDFIGLGYRCKNAISYKYKMDGIDHTWVNTSTPSARYPVINPGKYQFKVYAINEDGVESIQPALLRIAVSLPWWQKWWVILTAFALLIIAIGFLIQWRWRKMAQKKLVKNKINELRQQALQSQMNPHFIFNLLSVIQRLMMINEAEKANAYLSQFAKLIRCIFDYSEQKEITLEEEIDFLKLYLGLEKLRFKDMVQVIIKIDPSLEADLFDIKIPPLLLQPLVENAFKHGLFHKEGKGYVKLSFTRNKNYLLFSVEDNGIGRMQSRIMKVKNSHRMAHQSSGIRIIKERLRLLNRYSGHAEGSDLVIKDLFCEGQAVGTQIKVSIYCSIFN